MYAKGGEGVQRGKSVIHATMDTGIFNRTIHNE